MVNGSLEGEIKGTLWTLRLEYRRTKDPELWKALAAQYSLWARYNEGEGRKEYANLRFDISTKVKSLAKKYLRSGEEIINEHFHWHELGKQPPPATDWPPQEIAAVNTAAPRPDSSGHLVCTASVKDEECVKQVEVPFPGIHGVRVPATIALEWKLNPQNLFFSRHKFNSGESGEVWRGAGRVVGFLYHPETGEFLLEPLLSFNNCAPPSLALNEHGNYPLDQYVRGIFIHNEQSLLVKQKNKKLSDVLEKFDFGENRLKIISEDFDTHISRFVNSEFQEICR